MNIAIDGPSGAGKGTVLGMVMEKREQTHTRQLFFFRDKRTPCCGTSGCGSHYPCEQEPHSGEKYLRRGAVCTYAEKAVSYFYPRRCTCPQKTAKKRTCKDCCLYFYFSNQYGVAWI